ncbi:hypothetical protein [uncultured Methanobrevibacter sp.]|uniref:hypothetical protein n=1 Tax=uncultured Methanobrevibacter sp. TaxID=253161 RepID=UPI002614893A|nr:hypothetical protein [uncultured Methanobrevibacter sp.]
MNLNSSKSNMINYRDFIIFLVPILIFSLYLYVYNPGILTAASFSQLHQIATGDFTNAYPILHTFIEILCLKIWSSPMSIGVLQILVFCIMWTVICKYHRDDSAKSSDEFVFQFIITLIICLIPINAVYSITLSSNILFSYALMFLCFLIKVLIDNDWQIDTRLTILIALTIAAISGLNTFGVLIAIILLFLIAGYLFLKGTSQNTVIKLAGITIICIVLITSLNFVYDADFDNKNFKMNDAFEEGIDLQTAHSEFLSSVNGKTVAEYENASSVNLGNDKYDMVNSFVNTFRDNIILDGLFNSPIMNLIYSIILLGFMYLITQEREIFYVYVPIIVNIVIVLITGKNNSYSILLAFYLIAIIFISMYVKLGLKPQDIVSTAMNKTEEIRSAKPAQLETYQEVQDEPQPETYQENPDELQQESYEEEYTYIEEELEELTLDDINEMLGETQTEETQETVDYSSEGDSDLIDEILREIEMEKK